MKIVELNPFAEFASSGLFTWEKDWEILQGIKPFEFRFASTPPTGPNRIDLPMDWKNVIRESGIQITF